MGSSLFSISTPSAGELGDAVFVGDEARTLELLGRGADVNEKDGMFGNTLLHHACYCVRVELAKILLSRGADANAQDHDGMTPLHLLVPRLCGPLHNLISHLCRREPDVHAASADVQLVEALLAGGADVDVEDRWGTTPLNLARHYGLSAVVRLLEGARSARGARSSPSTPAEDDGGVAAEARAGPPPVGAGTETRAGPPQVGAAVEARARPFPSGGRPDGPAAADTSCPDDYRCPISHDVMEDPVMLGQSGHTYERIMLMEWFAHRPGVDPVTNKNFAGEPQLLRNHALRGAIAQWRERAAASSPSP